MANKPGARSWNDVQIVIATISMAFTLGLWNLFAGPDRETAFKRAQTQPTQQPIEQSPAPIIAQPVPTPLGDGVLLLGGSAPQTTVIVRSGGGNGGGNNNANNASGGGTGGS
jgi:hypothetical protein